MKYNEKKNKIGSKFQTIQKITRFHLRLAVKTTKPTTGTIPVNQGYCKKRNMHAGYSIMMANTRFFVAYFLFRLPIHKANNWVSPVNHGGTSWVTVAIRSL
jgi:hypothetical protein